MELQALFRNCSPQRVCLVGIGNLEWGDDGFGMVLAATLKDRFAQSNLAYHGQRRPSILEGGSTPENILHSITSNRFDHVILLDAVDFQALPGTVILLDGAQLEHRFPQISTHKISLGLLAKYVACHNQSRVWLLGVQPLSLSGTTLSPQVQSAVEVIANILVAGLTQASMVAPATPSAQAMEKCYDS